MASAGVLAVGALVAACVELSGPQESLASISPIRSAWPSVVRNDVLRDIAGVEAPLHVDAFDADGNVLGDATVSFVVLDQGISVDSRGVVHGLTESTNPVRIVAQVRRGDAVIQSPEIQVAVVPRADSTAPARDTTYDPVDVPAVDPSPITLDTLKVRVLNRASRTGIRSWLVRYEILHEPAGVPGRRTVQFKDGGDDDAVVSFDTTDGNGLASRTLELQRVALAEDGEQSVRILVTVGNTRPNRAPTMFFITIPINVETIGGGQ